MSHDSRQVAQELEGLRERVLTMAEAAEERLRIVMHALVDRDHTVLAAVIGGDARIDTLQIEIDDACFKLIALHQTSPRTSSSSSRRETFGIARPDCRSSSAGEVVGSLRCKKRAVSTVDGVRIPRLLRPGVFSNWAAPVTYYAHGSARYTIVSRGW